MSVNFLKMNVNNTFFFLIIITGALYNYLSITFSITSMKGQEPFTTFAACNSACNLSAAKCWDSIYSFVFRIHSSPTCSKLQSICQESCNMASIAAISSTTTSSITTSSLYNYAYQSSVMVFNTVEKLSNIRSTTETLKYIADRALNSASAIISDASYRDAVSSYFPNTVTNLALNMANTVYQASVFVISSKVMFYGAIAAVGTVGIYQTYSYFYDIVYTPRSNGPS
jgi:hypothetical protein